MARRNGRAGKNRADRRALGGAGTMAPRERLRFPEKWEGMKNRTSERTEPGKAVAATLPAAKTGVNVAEPGGRGRLLSLRLSEVTEFDSNSDEDV